MAANTECILTPLVDLLKGFLLGLLTCFQMQMETKLMQSTGNRLLSVHIVGNTNIPKHQKLCVSTSVMSKLVGRSQKLPLSMILLSMSSPTLKKLDTMQFSCLELLSTKIILLLDTG
ncbi:uncharacterized protein LOC108192606 isoform X2 [Daucus carota subsp. sativus]